MMPEEEQVEQEQVEQEQVEQDEVKEVAEVEDGLGDISLIEKAEDVPDEPEQKPAEQATDEPTEESTGGEDQAEQDAGESPEEPDKATEPEAGHNLDKGLQKMQQIVPVLKARIEQLEQAQSANTTPTQAQEKVTEQAKDVLAEIQQLSADSEDDIDVYKTAVQQSKNTKVLADRLISLEGQLGKFQSQIDDNAQVLESTSYDVKEAKRITAFNETYSELVDKRVEIENKAEQLLFDRVGGKELAATLSDELWASMSAKALEDTAAEYAKPVETPVVPPASNKSPKSPKGAKVISKGGSARSAKPADEPKLMDLVHGLIERSD